jgi:cyclophilin family peptidyl-prolyl cis-trans isomerase
MRLFVAPVLLLLFGTLSTNVAQTKGKDDPCPEPPSEKVICLIDTSMGKIKIELDEKKAPITVRNFLRYVKDRHYDDVVFHRVVSNFVIQGGGYSKGFGNATTAKEAKDKAIKIGKPIKNESSNGLSNTRGTLGMARKSEDADSATSQFYINLKDNSHLDKARFKDKTGYCVFGKVIEGLDIVDKIAGVRTKAVGGGSYKDVPVEEVVIKSIRRVSR